MLAGWLQLVPSEVVARYHGRMVNVHPALLPAFGGKGMYGKRVHQAVIAAGARVSGATVHLVDERYDEGAILAQWPVPVLPGDTPETLAARVLAVEHRILPLAVEALAREPATEGRMPLVLFITDGEPTVGLRDPVAIAGEAAKLRGRRRIFSFGVGADVNTPLVERLALEGRGTAHFVRPEESVERAVALVASRLTSPIATDLRVRAEGVRLSKMHPNGPVDLFAGQDLVVLARYDGTGRARIRFDGQTADGPVSWTETVRIGERERDNEFIPRLWATQRVGWLSAERRRNGPSPELDDEMRELGERYGIPTELTSYFVKEPGMVVAAPEGLQARVGAANVAPQTAAAARESVRVSAELGSAEFGSGLVY